MRISSIVYGALVGVVSGLSGMLFGFSVTFSVSCAVLFGFCGMTVGWALED